MSWLGNGASASLISNDVVVYGGGESLWILSLATLSWSEAWTTGQCPPHGLRFHTATALRLASSSSAIDGSSSASAPPRSQSSDSTPSAPTSTVVGAMIVLGGEPRASADLPEATQYGSKLNMHILKVRDRSWGVASCTGDVPENRCMHTTTKLRGTTLAVYGGRPLGRAHPTNEEASPIFEDTNELRQKLASDGFYDVFLVDANVGVWRRVTTVHRGSEAPASSSASDFLFQPCLWGHAAFATSVFPPRRSQSGEYRHRIDLVIQGGFDISPNAEHQNQVANKGSGAHSQHHHHAFVLQPVSETQPTVLKWGLAPLVVTDGNTNIHDDNNNNNHNNPQRGSGQEGSYTLHTAASADTSDGARGGGGAADGGSQPAFFVGGFTMRTEDDGEIGLAPSTSCGRISLRGSWSDGPRGQIASLPPLRSLMNTISTARPLLLFYSDQLLVLESTTKFWLLDLQASDEDQQQWAPVDTSLGPNEDVERWRIGCPLHPEFAFAGDENVDEIGAEAGTETAHQQTSRNQAHQVPNDNSDTSANVVASQQLLQREADETRREVRRQKRQERRDDKEKKKRELEASRKKQQPPPKPKPGDVRGEWKCLEDPKSGRTYYVNIKTRKSSWKIEDTSFIEPLPTDTNYDQDKDDQEDDSDLASTVSNEDDDDKKKTNKAVAHSDRPLSSTTWKEATRGETVRGYETSMMNPIYDSGGGDDQHDNNADHPSQAGTPHQLQRFLTGGTPSRGATAGGEQDHSLGSRVANNSNSSATWWNAAADARQRNVRDMSHSQAGLNQSVARADDEPQPRQPASQSNPPQLPPLPPPAPSRTPTSQIGPPSHVPTPSIWNEPHVDLPIDRCLRGIDSGEERERQVRRRNSLLNSMLTEDAVSRKKREEDERRAKALELLQLETKHLNSGKSRSGSSVVGGTRQEIAEIDPAEALDYPFDVETTLLLPHDTVLRARKMYMDKKRSEVQIPKERDIDIKKYLQQFTHWESLSDDGKKQERHQQKMQKHFSAQRPGGGGGGAENSNNNNNNNNNDKNDLSLQLVINNQFTQPRSVFDMLPSMLATGKFSDYVVGNNFSTSRFSAVGGTNTINSLVDASDGKENRQASGGVAAASLGMTANSKTSNDKDNNNNNNNNVSGRPSALVAADFSRTGSTSSYSNNPYDSRDSTPIAAQIFTDLIPHQHLDGVRKAMLFDDDDDADDDYDDDRMRRRSVSQLGQKMPVHGLKSHHVSQSIRDMIQDDQF